MQRPTSPNLPRIPTDDELREADPFAVLAIASALASPPPGSDDDEIDADRASASLAVLDTLEDRSLTPEQRSLLAEARSFGLIVLGDLPSAFSTIDALVSRHPAADLPIHVTKAVDSFLASVHAYNEPALRAVLALAVDRGWPSAAAALLRLTIEAHAGREEPAHGADELIIEWARSQRHDPGDDLPSLVDVAQLLLNESPLHDQEASDSPGTSVPRALAFIERVTSALSPPSFDGRSEDEHVALVDLQLEALRVLFSDQGRVLQRADPERWSQHVRRFGWCSFQPDELHALTEARLPSHASVIDRIAGCLQELVDDGAQELLPSLAHQRTWQAIYAPIEGGSSSTARELLAAADDLDERALEAGLPNAAALRAERCVLAAQLLAHRFAGDIAPAPEIEIDQPDLDDELELDPDDEVDDADGLYGDEAFDTFFRLAAHAFQALDGDVGRAKRALEAQAFDIHDPAFAALPEVELIRDLYDRAWESAASARTSGDLGPSLRLLRALRVPGGGPRLTSDPERDDRALELAIGLSDGGHRALRATSNDAFRDYRERAEATGEDLLGVISADIGALASLDPEHACWLATQAGPHGVALNDEQVRARVLDVARRHGTSIMTADEHGLRPIDYLAFAARGVVIDAPDEELPTDGPASWSERPTKVDMVALDQTLAAIAIAQGIDDADRGELVLDLAAFLQLRSGPHGIPTRARERLQQAAAATALPALLQPPTTQPRLAHAPLDGAVGVVQAAIEQAVEGFPPPLSPERERRALRGDDALAVIEALFDLEQRAAVPEPTPSTATALDHLADECRRSVSDLVEDGLRTGTATEQAISILLLLSQVETKRHRAGEAFGVARTAYQLTDRLAAQQSTDPSAAADHAASSWALRASQVAGLAINDPTCIALPDALAGTASLPNQLRLSQVATGVTPSSTARARRRVASAAAEPSGAPKDDNTPPPAPGLPSSTSPTGLQPRKLQPPSSKPFEM